MSSTETSAHTLAAEIIDVSKEYGEGTSKFAALKHIDLEIPRGEFCAIMGRSGSGKSTLLHLLAGLDRPTSGKLFVAGKDISHARDDELTIMRRRDVALIFQAFNLIDVMNAIENIALPLLVDGVKEKEALARAEAMIERVGLSHRKNHLPRELSGGEQQRVAIARALAVRPTILLADEPTGNLDSTNSERIIGLLRELAEDRSQTIIMVTHDSRQAEIADRIVEIRDGVIGSDRRSASL